MFNETGSAAKVKDEKTTVETFNERAQVIIAHFLQDRRKSESVPKVGGYGGRQVEERGASVGKYHDFIARFYGIQDELI